MSGTYWHMRYKLYSEVVVKQYRLMTHCLGMVLKASHIHMQTEDCSNLTIIW
jgi:hypothetical protein